MVEGTGDVPEPSEDNEMPGAKDDNVYKRIAEYVIDIGDICHD
jgi:hypothetical protein